MASDNIFSGLKVVDFASFIAGPSAAVILSDFGADVIKVEPPSGDLWRHGHQIPPQPQAKDAYPWHLANRNKRGITLDLKSPSASQVLEKARQVGRRAHRQHAASRTQETEARI
jgi:crotonobetainyl-CoA:carnitine CoA-transferase CaiB-like acyl-CoA transferase